MRRSPADGEVGVFLCLWTVVMEVFPRPDCYNSVPPCLCKKCQRYDVYMASCVPRTFGKTTCGLSVVNAARSSFVDIHSCSVRCKPARSRPVAPPVTSSSRLVAPPVTSKSVTARSRLVAPPVSARSSPVSSCAPFGSRTHTCTVAASSGPVAARPVAVSSVVSSPIAVPAVVSSPSSVGASSSVVVSRPVLSGSLACPVSVSPARFSPVGSLACPVTVSPVCPSPVVVPPSRFGSFSSGPAGSGSTVPRLVSPLVPLAVGSSPVLPFGRPVCSPVIPVVCFVLAVVPVLLFSPFGLIWSFLPVWH